MVDNAASEWIPIISGGPQGTVLGPLMFIPYTSEMFELVENRLFAYADDSTQLAVVRKLPVKMTFPTLYFTPVRWMGFNGSVNRWLLP